MRAFTRLVFGFAFAAWGSKSWCFLSADAAETLCNVYTFLPFTVKYVEGDTHDDDRTLGGILH